MPANERNKRLFAAARDGNTVDAEGALRAGCDVKALDNFNQTPLHWASAEGHVDMVKLLIKHGADVNLSDLYGFTPLHCAALEGRSSVARVLIDNGANVDAKNDDGECMSW